MPWLREPVPISGSVHSKIVGAVAAVVAALFVFYMYILHHAELLLGIFGVVMTLFGVIFFIADFLLIRFFINRNTRVQPDNDAG